MPLQLPTLDDRRYADLVAEARRLIPTLDPQWTNHNPSDPGIALIELFAYLTEMLLYRLDRVTVENQRKFLKLLNGPDWTASDDLAADVRATVLKVRSRERAVTAADFERLSTHDFNLWLLEQQHIEQQSGALTEWWRITRLDPKVATHRPSRVHAVARASCVPARNLERGTEAERFAPSAGHVSIVLLPQNPQGLQPTTVHKVALWGFLDERRMLTTRHHVVGPYYAPVSTELVVATRNDTPGALAAIRERVLQRLRELLDRFNGGEAAQGWPFGRDVFVSELYEQVEAVDGVDFVSDLMVSSSVLPQDQRCVAAAQMWHEQGDLIGLVLTPYQLPLARFEAAAIVIAPAQSFIRVQLSLSRNADIAAVPDPARLRRDVKQLIRRFFHPATLQPQQIAVDGGVSRRGVLFATLRADLEDLAGNLHLQVQAPPQRLLREQGTVIGLGLEENEVVDWHVEIAASF